MLYLSRCTKSECAWVVISSSAASQNHGCTKCKSPVEKDEAPDFVALLYSQERRSDDRTTWRIFTRPALVRAYERHTEKVKRKDLERRREQAATEDRAAVAAGKSPKQVAHERRRAEHAAAQTRRAQLKATRGVRWAVTGMSRGQRKKLMRGLKRDALREEIRKDLVREREFNRIAAPAATERERYSHGDQSVPVL